MIFETISMIIAKEKSLEIFVERFRDNFRGDFQIEIHCDTYKVLMSHFNGDGLMHKDRESTKELPSYFLRLRENIPQPYLVGALPNQQVFVYSNAYANYPLSIRQDLKKTLRIIPRQIYAQGFLEVNHRENALVTYDASSSRKINSHVAEILRMHHYKTRMEKK